MKSIILRACVTPALMFTLMAAVTSAPLCGRDIPHYAAGFSRPLEIDRGSSAVWQDLQKLQTRASLILVVWLGSADSRGVTGRIFEIEGGMISVADGWQHGPMLDKGARWEPAEVGAAVRELIAKAPPPAPVYGAQ